MKVLVEFERAYAGPSLDAVWIIDTPLNRRWFEQHTGSMDANSAVFVDDADPLTIIWNVFDHHPDWTEIYVRGANLTRELEVSIQPNAKVVSKSRLEFELRRP